MKTIKINSTEIGFSRETYSNNGNLAIQCWVVKDGVFIEPYAMLTVNLNKKHRENCAFVDYNNCPSDIISVLEDNGWAETTWRIEGSGFCTYYEYEFSDEFLREVVA